jgi:hypothetical protein
VRSFSAVEPEEDQMGLFGSSGKWQMHQTGSNKYYRGSAGTLFEATETLNGLNQVPSLTYYIVETPDGNLGRDCEGFYTEAPLKTQGVRLKTKDGVGARVEFESLVFPGNVMLGAQMVAQLRSSGGYAKLIFTMKCGRCGYDSPVEADAGTVSRECYRCGATNTGQRMSINLATPKGYTEV